jgi:hypothetical protein
MTAIVFRAREAGSPQAAPNRSFIQADANVSHWRIVAMALLDRLGALSPTFGAVRSVGTMVIAGVTHQIPELRHAVREVGKREPD